MNRPCDTRDHLGSVRELVDATGTLQTRYGYDMWGKRVKLSGTPDSEVGYTGHHHHAKSGLILTWYRAYDAEAGRWLSADPIEESGGMNLYGYVGNGPLDNWDPHGLLIVHYWEGQAINQHGHLSMTLENGTYISNWPADGRKHPSGGGDTRPPSYAKDLIGEDNREPKNLRIDGLDEVAIKEWWSKQERGNGYAGLGTNCSSTVSHALRAGGIRGLESQLIYTPKSTWKYINEAYNRPLKPSLDWGAGWTAWSGW